MPAVSLPNPSPLCRSPLWLRLLSAVRTVVVPLSFSPCSPISKPSRWERRSRSEAKTRPRSVLRRKRSAEGLPRLRGRGDPPGEPSGRERSRKRHWPLRRNHVVSRSQCKTNSYIKEHLFPAAATISERRYRSQIQNSINRRVSCNGSEQWGATTRLSCSHGACPPQARLCESHVCQQVITWSPCWPRPVRSAIVAQPLHPKPSDALHNT